MRSFKEFIVDIAKKPPILFPLVGLFHLFWLLWTIWSDHNEPFPGIVWLQVLWLAAFTFFWIGTCDLRKWGALGYIILTIVDTSVYLAVRNNMLSEMYISNIFLIDGLFSVFLLYYYKQFK